MASHRFCVELDATTARRLRSKARRLRTTPAALIRAILADDFLREDMLASEDHDRFAPTTEANADAR